MVIKITPVRSYLELCDYKFANNFQRVRLFGNVRFFEVLELQ